MGRGSGGGLQRAGRNFSLHNEFTGVNKNYQIIYSNHGPVYINYTSKPF